MVTGDDGPAVAVRRALHVSASQIGYGMRLASRMSGASERQLDYWSRTGLVRPSVVPARGSGHRRLWSRSDIALAAILAALHATGHYTSESSFRVRRTVSAVWYRHAPHIPFLVILDGKAVSVCMTEAEALAWSDRVHVTTLIRPDQVLAEVAA